MKTALMYLLARTKPEYPVWWMQELAQDVGGRSSAAVGPGTVDEDLDKVFGRVNGRPLGFVVQYFGPGNMEMVGDSEWDPMARGSRYSEAIVDALGRYRECMSRLPLGRLRSAELLARRSLVEYPGWNDGRTFVSYFREFAGMKPQEYRARYSVAYNARVEEAMRWALDRLGEPITIWDVADRAGYSVTTLNTEVRKHLDMSLAEWLRWARIQYACEMLRQTDSPIDEIRRRSGVGKMTTFQRLFKEMVGGSPSMYRARNRSPATTTIAERESGLVRSGG